MVGSAEPQVLLPHAEALLPHVEASLIVNLHRVRCIVRSALSSTISQSAASQQPGISHQSLFWCLDNFGPAYRGLRVWDHCPDVYLAGGPVDADHGELHCPSLLLPMC